MTWTGTFKLLSLVTVSMLCFGCSSFNLVEHQGSLAVKKQRRAKDVVCAVKPFVYVPIESDETDLMTPEDLKRWQNLFAVGLNQSDIFKEVAPANGSSVPENTTYVVDGRIKRFYFKKNWVPVFFPLHLGASFFTLTIYTWLGGPTTTTKVDFQIEVDLKDARSGALIKTFPYQYSDTSGMNVYTKDVNNPYHNPGGLVFSKAIEGIATDMAAALP